MHSCYTIEVAKIIRADQIRQAEQYRAAKLMRDKAKITQPIYIEASEKPFPPPTRSDRAVQSITYLAKSIKSKLRMMGLGRAHPRSQGES
jgi:hypothetical protein